MKPIPPPLSLRMSIEDSHVFESDSLGELLDRRANTIGFRITQPLSGQTSLKVANRLSQGERVTNETVTSLLEFFENLKLALGLSESSWYWFVNPGHDPPPDARVVRVDSVEGPDYDCYAGLDECVLATTAGETDIRGCQVVEVAEGVFGVASETALQRFGPHIDEAVAFLAPHPRDQQVQLSLWQIRRKANATWKSFSRKRLGKRAKPLPKVADKILTPRLNAHGFELDTSEAATEGTIMWVRNASGETQYVAIDRNRFDAGFRIFLSRGLQPFAVENRGAELVSSSSREYSFSSQATLEAAMRSAYDHIVQVGFRWFENPNAMTREEWLTLRLRPE